MADGSSEDRVGPKQNMNDSTFSAPDKGLGDTKMCSGETFDGDSVKLSFYRELETSDSCEKSDTRGVAAKRAAVGGSYSRKFSDANTLYGDDRKRRCLDRYDSSESSDRSARESYGDDAIGYVQLKRDDKICTVKCKICPEHKVRSKQYTVTVVIDEEEEKVVSALCEDCPAAAGGCKHATAFLTWLLRRSEEPACTSVECYWKKSNLSKVGSTLKIITAKEMCKRKHQDPVPDTSVLTEFIDECKKRRIETCQFLKHVEDYTDNRLVLSLHYLLNTYKESDCESFLTKIKAMFNDENIKNAEMQTRQQYKSGLWFELRYGRVTASKCHEVSRCKTIDGSLVAIIFGARSVQTPAIKRGQKLEDKVREIAEEKLGVKFTKCGLFISDEYPMIAGSPDGINREKGLIEIKCPSTDKNFENYIKDGNLTKKCFAQVQIQMFCAKVNQSYFCVASSDFEHSKKVTILPVSYNDKYVKKLIGQVVSFWKLNIFPKLYESVTM